MFQRLVHLRLSIVLDDLPVLESLPTRLSGDPKPLVQLLLVEAGVLSVFRQTFWALFFAGKARLSLRKIYLWSLDRGRRSESEKEK